MGDMRKAYGETLLELGKQHEEIVVVDADLASSTRTKWFQKEFPDRFFNFGVAEANMMNHAAGLALSGKVVFASTFAMFATGRAWDPIRNTIASSNLNVKIVATHSGLAVGEDGFSHQAVEDIALMRCIPNMKIVVPADENETRAVIKYVYETPGTFYVRLVRPKTPDVYSGNVKFELGKGEVLREGKKVAIFVIGALVPEVLKARDELKNAGIEPTVINMSSVKPIDEDLIIDIAKTHEVLFSVEDHSIIGGLGSAIAEVLVEKHPAKLIRIGVPDRYGESGTPDELWDAYGLSARKIAEKVKSVIG